MNRLRPGYSVGQLIALVILAAGLWLKFDLGVMLIAVGVILAIVFVLLERFDTAQPAVDAIADPRVDDDGQPARAVPPDLADEHALLMAHERAMG